MRKFLLPVLLCFIVATFSGARQKSCNFVGEWNTDWGILTITEKYGKYTGSYPVNYGTGYLSGEMTKGEWDVFVLLKGTWQEGKATGKFEFKRFCDKNSFSGTWTNDNVKEKGTWNGTKIR